MVRPSVHKLRNWRVSQSLSHEAAGELVGVTRQCWFDWEKGKRTPGYCYMIRLYVLTDGTVTPNDFYDLPELPAKKRAA